MQPIQIKKKYVTLFCTVKRDKGGEVGRGSGGGDGDGDDAWGGEVMIPLANTPYRVWLLVLSGV